MYSWSFISFCKISSIIFQAITIFFSSSVFSLLEGPASDDCGGGVSDGFGANDSGDEGGVLGALGIGLFSGIGNLVVLDNCFSS